jgi:hypothetical protein
MGQRRGACMLYMGKSEGRRPLESWEYNIKMDLR